MKQKKSFEVRRPNSLHGVKSMNQWADGPKRNRRLYSRSGDASILKIVSKYQFLTVEMAAEEIHRNVISVRRRMMQLYQAGFLNRARRDKLAPWAYFLSEKGSAKAIELGFINEPRFIKSKSSL